MKHQAFFLLSHPAGSEKSCPVVKLISVLGQQEGWRKSKVPVLHKLEGSNWERAGCSSEMEDPEFIIGIICYLVFWKKWKTSKFTLPDVKKLFKLFLFMTQPPLSLLTLLSRVQPYPQSSFSPSHDDDKLRGALPGTRQPSRSLLPDMHLSLRLGSLCREKSVH